MKPRWQLPRRANRSWYLYQLWVQGTKRCVAEAAKDCKVSVAPEITKGIKNGPHAGENIAAYLTSIATWG